MRKLSTLLTTLFLVSVFAYAEGKLNVRGTVIDRDGNPIPGVAVMIEGTQIGVMTDINGYYVIDIPSKDVKLLFSSIGFKDQINPVPSNLSLDVYMDIDANILDEAVVVGMGTQRRASVIGSISSVGVDELTIPQRNLTNALAGKVSGAVVVQRTGEPGMDNAEFWIRGISSLNSSAPLILVDGVERSMDDLAIEEIESVSLLKDAAATAVYGVRAANGVVLVTTRRGIAQKPEIEVKIEGGMSNLTNMPQMIDGGNYMRLANEAAGYEMYSREQIDMTSSYKDPYLYPNVNWFDTLFTDFSSNMQASLTVRGGGERARYYVAFSYIMDNGNLKNNPANAYSSNIHVQRYNFRSNVDMDITKSTVLSLEIGANMTDAHQPAPITSSTSYTSVASELFSECYAQNPVTTPVRVPLQRDINGNWEWGWGSTVGTSTANPAERLFGSGYNKTYKTQIMSQISLKQDLSMLTEGLNFRFSFSYDANLANIQSRRKYSSLYAIIGVAEDEGYILSTVREGDEFLGYSEVNQSDRSNELKAQFNYDRIFNSTHNVSSMLMYYQRSYIVSSTGSSIKSLPYRKQGIAFRVAYSYDNRYFAEFNCGFNGSENFEPGKRFGFFPAGAIGYIMSGEKWWNLPWWNYLKFRASTGLVGSDVLAANGRFGYLSTWGTGLGGHRFGPSASYYSGIGESQIGVEGLTWEKGHKSDVGIETRFFGGDISLDLDGFYEHRWDILIQRSSVPGIAGLNVAPYANMGVMDNYGFESTLSLSHTWNGFFAKLYGNFTFARNKIIEKDEAPTDPWRMRTGHPYGQCFGLQAIGLFKDEEDIANSPQQQFGEVRPGDVKYLDYNKDGVVDSHDEIPIGYAAVPEINYGFGVQFAWKGFDLGVFFRGQAHVTYSLNTTFFPFYSGVGKNNLFTKALDRAQVAKDPITGKETCINPDAFYPRLSASANTNNMKASTRTIYSGDLLRLSDFEFGYTFSGNWLQKIACKSIRLYFVGSNLALFAPWTMWDPETGSGNGNSYPLSRKMNFGVKFTF